MEFKLSKCISNTKAINGWNVYNEKIFNSLTWEEKEAVNLLIIEQFEFFKKHERVSFINLVSIVKKNKTVIHLTDEMISKNQMRSLLEEVKHCKVKIK